MAYKSDGQRWKAQLVTHCCWPQQTEPQLRLSTAEHPLVPQPCPALPSPAPGHKHECVGTKRAASLSEKQCFTIKSQNGTLVEDFCLGGGLSMHALCATSHACPSLETLHQNLGHAARPTY